MAAKKRRVVSERPNGGNGAVLGFEQRFWVSDEFSAETKLKTVLDMKANASSMNRSD